MISGPPKNSYLVILATCVLAWFVTGLVALPWLKQHFLERAGLEQRPTLTLATQSLRSTLQRYAPMPALVAGMPEMRLAVQRPDNPVLRESARHVLEDVAIALNASGVYLEDADGVLIAGVPEVSASGGSIASYRPYFNQVVAGGLLQYFALGRQSGERGYFYAAPVRGNSRILGIVAVTFSVDQFEATWRGGSNEVIVRDPNGIVFMSSRQDWNFKTLDALDDRKLAAIDAAQQYPVDRIEVLETSDRRLTDDHSIMRIAGGDGSATDYVTSTDLIARAGWRVTILTPTRAALAQARFAATLVALVIAVVGLLVAIIVQRRSQLVERLRAKEEVATMLESRVRARTRELDEANRMLRAEVEERRSAEARLRKTQSELVQAGKLAALGQMSAAISHELNQPLAAVKSYADNALAYLDRGRSDEAAGNITRIATMVDRMSSIAKHLRNFARRPQETVHAVPLQAIIDDAVDLMGARLRAMGTELVVKTPLDGLHVMGGRVRLQQIVVNLLSNALDAMENQADRRIEIDHQQADDVVRLMVRDVGPGLEADVRDAVFDPFFSTKQPGKGLGLGLSISYNIMRDFGGNLSAENHPDGGAVFTMTLRRAPSEDAAVEAAQ